MTTGHVFMAMSLDGFISRSDDALDWLMKQPTEGEEHGYMEFVGSVDGIVMGSASFRNVLTFADWPYDKPVVVVSKTLTQADVPAALRDSVSVSSLEPGALMASLGRDGWNRAYVDGGKIVQSFLKAGQVADLNITTIPILLGNGKRLFGTLAADVDLQLLRSESFESGLVQSVYAVVTNDE